MGKSGREIWISVFAMIISCPELVKIKRGNKIKEVRSGVVGTAGGTMAVRSGVVGTAGGTMAVRSERYVVRSGVVGTAGVRDGVRSGMAMRAAVG